MRPAIVSAALLLVPGWCAAGDVIPSGWSFQSPRDEIRPLSRWQAGEGPDGRGEFLIFADNREGLAGYWAAKFRVNGGKFYRFEVARRTEKMNLERRAAIARIIWLDDSGSHILRPSPATTPYRKNEHLRAEPEFPKPASSSGGWTTLQGVYQAPPEATAARVELHFRWGSPDSSVRWSLPTLEPTAPPPRRIVRLAAVHYQPLKGQTPKEKCEQFSPFIQQAAEQNIDLVVLPETLTYYATPGGYIDVAETVPGPSTEYFGSLAKKHDLYIVAGLVERDGHLVYNVSVLLGPDGKMVGKYRKVTLPRSEIEGGLTPGDEYPVFETRFGKVGMMICYDGFFPEVARELSNRGAEVIAWPVWGCNPLLSSARSCENHVYLVSSTYTEFSRNWTQSAIYGHDGTTLAVAQEFGTLAIAQVDLSQPLYWHSLGDFQAQIQPHRPRIQPTP